MKILDVTNVIVTDDELVCVLFDGRYDAITVIKFDQEQGKMLMADPTGDERVHWLDALGLLSEVEIEAEYERLKLKPAMIRALYDKLKRDYED